MNDRNAFKAGLFIVISILLVIGMIVGIKGAGQLLEPNQYRSAEFTLSDDVEGLRVGDDVRIGGMKVGIIRSVHVEQKEDGDNAARVLVKFNIPRRLTLREGAHIEVQATLTGTSWLNFDNLGKGTALADDMVLTGAPSAYTVLANSINSLTPEIQKLTTDIRTVTLPKVNNTVDTAGQTFTAAKSKIDGVVAQYNKVVDRTAEVMVEVRDIFGDTKPDIRKLMANGAAVAGSLKDKLPPALDEFDKLLNKINAELESTTGVLAEIRATATNLKDVTGSARSILITNHSRIDEIVVALKTAGDNLKFATAEIRHSPWRLLYKPKAGEVANLNIYDSTRQFAEGANSLSDAASALRDALKDPAVDKTKVDQLMQKLDDSFGEFEKVEGNLWKQVKE